MTYLTPKDILKIAETNPYFLLRNRNNDVISINAKLVNYCYKNSLFDLSKPLVFYSYNPCSLNEYINQKFNGCILKNYKEAKSYRKINT
jgi:hypothetical protein